MKKLFLLVFLVLYGLTTSHAQDNDFIAFTGGFFNTNTKVNVDNEITKSSDNGLYVGILTETYISYEIWLQTELLFARANNISYLQLPILAKFYISKRMNLLAGPQISYTFGNVIDDEIGDYSKFNIGVDAGIGYNITEKLMLNTKYTFQINDYYTGNGATSLKTNFFTVGLAYKISTWK